MTESTAAPIRVLVVDDHDVFASSLAQVLSLEPDLLTLGTAHSIAEARTMIPNTLPDVVLMDHRLPDGDGVSAIVELQPLRLSTKYVVLTASTADHVLVAAKVSMTIRTPASVVRRNASWSTTPSWNHTAFAPIATASSANCPAASERRKTSTTSTGKGMSASVA